MNIILLTFNKGREYIMQINEAIYLKHKKHFMSMLS